MVQTAGVCAEDSHQAAWVPKAWMVKHHVLVLHCNRGRPGLWATFTVQLHTMWQYHMKP